MGISVASFQAECSDALRLRFLAGERGKDRVVTLLRPQETGLGITGEALSRPTDRIQILGEAEIAFFRKQEPSRQEALVDGFFSCDFPCAIVGGDVPVPPPFLEAADRHAAPLFSSPLPAAELAEEIHRHLHRILRETATIHGVLMEVLGVGVLLVGRSGVGKSECALDLILRGSRFVADDIILVEKVGAATLVGGGSDLTRHHMEIRGLGILNIRDLFGLTATSAAKKLELVIRIEEWEPQKEYDRLGVEEDTVEILGVRLPSLLIPVSPGRNLATVVEVAARNHLLKMRGVRSAWDLVERQSRKAGEPKSP